MIQKIAFAAAVTLAPVAANAQVLAPVPVIDATSIYKMGLQLAQEIKTVTAVEAELKQLRNFPMAGTTGNLAQVQALLNATNMAKSACATVAGANAQACQVKTDVLAVQGGNLGADIAQLTSIANAGSAAVGSTQVGQATIAGLVQNGKLLIDAKSRAIADAQQHNIDLSRYISPTAHTLAEP